MERMKKGTFLPHVARFAGVSFGLDVIEELQGYLKINYSLKLGKDILCDSEDHINHVKIKELTNQGVSHEVKLDEDVIRNCETFDEIFQRKRKWNILVE